MKALVTGGAGFIGSHLSDALIAQGASVVVFDDLSTGFVDNVNPAADFVKGDLCDLELLTRAMQGCDVVYHQAALRAVFRSVVDPVETDRVNVAGTLTALVAAREAGVRRFVAASSSSVYGGSESLPTPESAALVPRSPYAVSKVTGENYCRVFSELYDIETVCLRYFNVYGPRQRPDSQYAAVIPLFIAALAAGVAPEVHGDGLQSRDFTFIDDVVRANLRAAVAPAAVCAGRAYNVGAGTPVSLLDLLTELSAIVGVSIAPRHTASRAGDVRHTSADTSSIAADLGYRSQVSLSEGLRRTVAWFDELAIARAG